MDRYKHTSDPSLLSLLTAGDRHAFEEIYRRYAPALFKYTSQSISDRDECHEILQDVFESLWLRREVLHIEHLQAYLYNMVRYRMIRYFRREKLLRKYADHYTAFESVHEAQPAEQDPEKIRQLILESLEGLSERCRTAFQLRMLENLSNGEIAERMNITKGTVELYMVKAMQHLRSHKRLKEALGGGN